MGMCLYSLHVGTCSPARLCVGLHAMSGGQYRLSAASTLNVSALKISNCDGCKKNDSGCLS